MAHTMATAIRPPFTPTEPVVDFVHGIEITDPCCRVEDHNASRTHFAYHGLQDEAAYPAIMLISGDADMRYRPTHARRTAAYLQATNTSEHLIFLDYKPNRGHAPVQPLDTQIALTDRLAFIRRELSVKSQPLRCS